MLWCGYFVHDWQYFLPCRATPSGSTPKNGDGGSDAGTNWLMFELLWRDFFRYLLFMNLNTYDDIIVLLTTL
jgi:hypothetical protein